MSSQRFETESPSDLHSRVFAGRRSGAFTDSRCDWLGVSHPRCRLIRRRLEVDPAGDGNFLSEGLYYIDEEPLRAFFLIDVESASVEITDFRIL